MELGKQGLGCSPAPFTAQDAGEAEKENSELLLPASRTGFNGFWQKGKEERTEDSELWTKCPLAWGWEYGWNK